MNRWSVVFLLGLGSVQMIGDVLQTTWLKAMGAASCASPAPRVFSASRGLETYSTRFFLEWTDDQQTAHSLEVDSRVYSRLQGPYNRRNVYGAAMAYGPILASDSQTRPLLDSVLQYAFCGEAPVLRELGIDPEAIEGPIRIRFEPVAGTDLGSWPRVLEANCP